MKAVKFFEEFCQEFSKILAAHGLRCGADCGYRASGGDIFADMNAVMF